jgi:CysZ protein
MGAVSGRTGAESSLRTEYHPAMSALEPTSTRTPRKGMAGFVAGFSAPFLGFQFLWRNPRLWQYALWPILLNVLITGMVTLGLVFGIWWLLSAWHASFPEAWWGRVLEVLAGILVSLVGIALAAVTWFVLQMALNAWFYFELARETEIALGRPRESLREAPILVQIRDGLLTALRLLGLNLILVVLNVVPVVGTALAAVGTVLCNAWVLGASHLDYPLSLRARTGAEKRQIFHRNRATTFGLGLAVLLLVMIPLAGAVLLTTAVVGGILLYDGLDQ